MAPKRENVPDNKILIKPTSREKESIFKLAANDKNCVDIQKTLRTLDFNVNMECDQHGDFLLHIAAKNGQGYLPILMALVKTHGADIDISNADGMTPLMLAASCGDSVLCDVLICLLEADPNKHNAQSGKSALHYAAEGNHRKTVECLIQRGADINLEDHEGLRADDVLTPWNNDCLEIILFNRMKRIEMLSDMVKKGEILSRNVLPSDLCVVDNEGQTLIMTAAVHNKFKCLYPLLQIGKSTMNAQHSKTGMTALAMAARLGNLEAVEVLLRYKACPLVADMEGYLPIHHAVVNNHEPVVDVFLGCFPNAFVGLYKAIHLCKTYSLHNRLKFAWEKRQEQIVTPKLLECAISGKAEELFRLLDEGDSINQRGGAGIWPLYLAAENGHLEVLQLLCENGADVAKQHPVTGGTLLHVAARMGHLSIVNYLLQFCKTTSKNYPVSTNSAADILHNSKSAQCQGKLKSFLDINTVDRNNKTALQIAAEKGLTQIVELLLSNGATTGILDGDGELLTSFQFEGVQVAIETHRQQHTQQIMEIIESKSGKSLSTLHEIWLPKFDHNLRDKEGRTPLMMATKSGKVPVINFLLQSAIYSEESLFHSERENSDNDSDTDSGVLDLSPQDISNNDDEFEMSLDRITLEAHLNSEMKHDNVVSADLQTHNRLTDYSEYHQKSLITSITTDSSEHKGHSIFQGGLISHVCAVNLKDGSNVLHYAIHNSDAPHILALLLERDPTPLNMQDDRGETVLHLACRLERKKSIKLILARHDVDLNIHTFDGRLPEDLTSSTAIQKMVKTARSS